VAGDGGIQRVGEGIVDDADTGAAGDGEAEGDAGVGEGVDEVGCAVDLGMVLVATWWVLVLKEGQEWWRRRWRRSWQELLAAGLEERETYGVNDESWCVGQGEAGAVGFFADESGEVRRRD